MLILLGWTTFYADIHTYLLTWTDELLQFFILPKNSLSSSFPADLVSVG